MKYSSYKRFVFILALLLVLPLAQSQAQNPEWMYFDDNNTNMPNDKIWCNWIEPDYAGNVWWVQGAFNPTTSVFNGSNYMAVPEIITYLNVGLKFDSYNQPFYLHNGGLATFRNDSILYYTCIECANQQLNYSYQEMCIDNNDAVWLFSKDNDTLTHFLCKKTVSSLWSVFHAPDSIINLTVTEMIAAENGDIWIMSDSAGLVMFDGQNWHTYRTENSDLPTNIIYDIACSDDGTIYITSSEGISYYSGGIWHTNSVYAGTTKRIARGHNNEVWAITDTHSIVKISSGAFSDINAQGDALQMSSFLNIAVDANDNVWIIGQWQGAAAYHPGGVLLKNDETHAMGSVQSSIYPNPAADFISVQNTSRDRIQQVKIYNAGMQCQLCVENPANSNIDVSKLVSGLYFVEIITSGNHSFQKLVIR
ncbi:MAG: T9SS type A sorting domain-containing protein [Bacteroidetes bacterium]|nr:T9SS type A sorting domain-containing protein [Bacteroidota bacterium]